MKINKRFNSSIGTQLIYDKDILIAQEDGSVDSPVQFNSKVGLAGGDCICAIPKAQMTRVNKLKTDFCISISFYWDP